MRANTSFLLTPTMSTASDALPENSGGPAVTKPATTNVEAMDNPDEEKDVAAPAQPYAEYVNPAKSRKRFGLKGSTPYRPPKGKLHFYVDGIVLIAGHQATIPSITKKSIQKMCMVKRWDRTLGYFEPALMSARYMMQI